MSELIFETVTTHKTVQRTAMSDHEYLIWWSEHSSEVHCADLSTAGVDMRQERPGYLVRYQSGSEREYYSWSPKEIMDEAILPPMKTIEINLDEVGLVSQFKTPLFQKAYDEFVRQAGMVSLPQALEAAIVVYTDGLTYSEE